jgi:hypothetical protein
MAGALLNSGAAAVMDAPARAMPAGEPGPFVPPARTPRADLSWRQAPTGAWPLRTLKAVASGVLGERKYQRLRHAAEIRQLKRRAYAQSPHRIDRTSLRRAAALWARYGLRLNQNWHRTCYALNPVSSPELFIPDDLYYVYLERAFVPYELAGGYMDKTAYHRLFPGAPMPHALLRSIAGRFYDEAYERLEPADVDAALRNAEGDFIIKPAWGSGGGRNVNLIKINRGKLTWHGRRTDLVEVLAHYPGDFVLQECVRQHAALAEYHAESANTVRAVTFRSGDEFRVIAAMLRFGGDGRCVDNLSRSGVACGVSSDGRVRGATGLMRTLQRVPRHPDSGLSFENFVIPGWDRLVTLVTGLHRTLPHFEMASWDVAIDVDAAPSIIEINLLYQEIITLQVLNGPLFGAETEAVLERCLGTT